jgi:hypothetical protein
VERRQVGYIVGTGDTDGKGAQEEVKEDDGYEYYDEEGERGP